MAVILRSNGIIEEYRPNNLIFTEDELLDIFKDYKTVKTKRLISVLNAWCIYGVPNKIDITEFNKLASDVAKETIYSHALFVHDSELNQDWKVTEEILYKSYDEFLFEIKRYIDEIASNIIMQYQAMVGENEEDVLPQLTTIGITNEDPKRILFGFDPTEQSQEFYKNDQFYKFSQRIYEYLSTHKQDKEPFTIYADKKAVIIVDPNHVISFLNIMIEKFKSKEEYEICNVLSNLIQKWPPKPKKTRKKKTSQNINGNNELK